MMNRQYISNMTNVNVRRVSFLLALLVLAVGTATAQVHVHGSVYGGGALANANDPESAEMKTATVNLTGGTIDGDVYGGGLGQLAKAAVGTVGEVGYKPAEDAVAALVGNTVVNLNGTRTEETTTDAEGNETTTVSYNDNCVVKGSIFGCNNINGTPKGNATVHIYKTQGYDGHYRTGHDAETAAEREALLNDDDATHHSYELKAVYGGGNLAAYVPTAAGASTHVIIDGCQLTSIRQVYGGGNAASTPATDVTVNGSYEIEEVFGGGNGLEDISKDGGVTYIKNPGANVGYKDYWDYEKEKDMEDYDTKEKRQKSETFQRDYVYGSGKAAVNIFGGRIHRVFGGSNTRGNVHVTAVTMLDNRTDCDFLIDEAYGGGKSASMDAEARLLMACVPGLKEVYGGAEEADIQGDVTLTITNGTFDRVFGGNNISGTIGGSITVNVEETGCQPIVIGELYGGGNKAPYSIYGYDRDNDGNVVLKKSGDDANASPVVNIKAFTSIGNVYGGGFGAEAEMVGSPTVNISVAEGRHSSTEVAEGTTTSGGFPVPSHAAGSIGAVNNVYGGGNEAKVVGDTNVNIGTLGTVTVSVFQVDDDNLPVLDEDGNQVVVKEEKEVRGADIRGNVYGGGNQAEVTGDTNVTIGREYTTPAATPDEPATEP